MSASPNCYELEAIENLLPEEKVELLALLEKRNFLADQQNVQDLASFARAGWQVLEPGTELSWNWHLDLLCEYLTLLRDRAIRRLIINVPPQTMKSRLVNVFYPCWAWATIPSRRFLSSSYSGDLSAQFNVERRKLLQSEWFAYHWPDKVILASDQNRKASFENIAGGRMSATSTGGTATGKGAHDIICDDPLNPKQAASEVELKNANVFFDQTLRTRLSDQISGAIVIVMQRLAEDDLTGHLLAKHPDEYTHVRIPMVAEENETWSFPISKRVHARKEGELLWPHRFPQKVCDDLKVDVGSFGWAGQYQQRPTPQEGAIIKRHWLRYWTRLPEQFDVILASWDMAFKDAKDSSRVCGQIWGMQGSRRLLLDEVCDLMDFTQTQKAVISLHEKWPKAHMKLVEDKANGPAIISSLRQSVPGLIAVSPDGSKEARMFAESPTYEAGNVEYPDPSMPGYGWVQEHIEEVCGFPLMKYNDRPDAESQALNRLRSMPSGIMGWYRQQAEAKK
jgi:predicted phage terminase large subunit-like protein